MAFSSSPGAIIRIGVDGASESNREIDTVTRNMNNLASTVQNAMRNLAGAVGVGAGISGIIQMSDEYAKFTAQLKLASLSQREYLASYADVKRIANAANQGLLETGILYARIANGTRELGVAQKQVARITETVNLSLLVSGASATEAASAQLQLSQAFASGTLRGEEFNAVNEAAPRLMLALADGIGVPVGALKKMAEEGQITSKIMADVLPNALARLREEAKEVQTIAGAFTVLKNNMMEFVGIQANASGAVSALTGSIGFLANNLVFIAGAVATLTAAKLASWLAATVSQAIAAVAASRALAAANLAAAQSAVAATGAEVLLTTARLAEARASTLAAAGNVQIALTTNALIPAQTRAAAAVVLHTEATLALAVAQRAASVSAGVLSTALRFFGGPIGLIVTLLGAAATAWALMGNKAEAANQQAAASTEESTNEMIKRLDKQIEKLRERNRLQDTEPRVSGLSGASETDLAGLARAKAALDANRAKPMTGMTQLDDIELTRNYETALQRVSQVQDEVNAASKRGRDIKIKDWYAQNGTNAQKMAAELEKLRMEMGTIPPEMEKMVRARYADKSSAPAIKAEANAYKTLMTSIAEKIAANKIELAGHGAMTDAQKMTIKLDAAIATGKNKLTPLHVSQARAEISVVAAQDAQIASTKSVSQAVQQLNEERDGAYVAAMAEVAANEELVARYGMTKLQIEQLTLARLEDQLAQRAALDLDEKAVAQLERMIAAKRRSVTSVRALEGLDKGSDVTKAKELLDIMTAVDEVTKEAASSMAASFGRVGSAIGDLTTALTGYGRAQAAIAAQLANEKRDAKNDPVKLRVAETKAAQASATAQVRQYGDMASAAKGFFKENSAGYKVMQGAEKSFRAYEMAMALQAMVKKIFFKESEVAANMALNGTKLAGEATTTAASTGLAATEASAWGITAVVKAIASMPFPLNLAAGAATLAAVVALGAKMVGGIGGGSVSLSEQRQKEQGTGTVFGNSSAKSESISRSLSFMAENSNIELNYTRGMLMSLRSIETALGGLGNLLIRGSGVSGKFDADSKGAAATNAGGKVAVGVLGGALGVALDGLLGGKLSATLDKLMPKFLSNGLAKLGNALFGGNMTTLDTGLTATKGTLGSVLSGGLKASQYTDTKKDGGLFSSDKYRTNTKDLGGEANQQFTLVIGGMADAVKQAGSLLGVTSSNLQKFVVDLGKISLKGLSGDEIQKELESAFSKVGDDMARFAIAGLAPFQEVGEGYMETLIRVASNYANLDATLQSIGMTFGATGLASLAARENLISMAGGISDLASKAASFADNFLTEGERLAPIVKYVTDQLAAMGLAHIDTREEFKNHVLSLKLVSAAEREQFTALMDLEGAFAKAYAATEDLTMSEQAIADQRKDLQSQWDELTMTSAQLRAKERAAIAESNLGLYDQVVRQRDLREATLAATEALKSTIERLTSAKASTLAYRDSLMLGTLSTLTPMQKYLETQRQYAESLVKANSAPADSAAQSAVQSAATAFLSASQVINASSAAYINDKSKILGDMTTLAAIAGAQMTDAQLQLSRMDAQVSGIATLNNTALAIEQAILSQNMLPTDGFDAQRYGAGSSAAADTLAAEVKALRAEAVEARRIASETLAEIQKIRADAERHAREAGDIADEQGRGFRKDVTGAVDRLSYVVTNPMLVRPR